MRKYIISLTMTSCLMVSNLMAIDYNEALNLIKNKSFKVFKLHGCNASQQVITFDNNGSSSDGTLTLLEDNATDEMSGQNIPNGTISDTHDVYSKIGGTIVDYDEKGILISTGQVSDGTNNLVGDILWLYNDFQENLIDMQTMLPFHRGNTVFNTDGTITNYWNNETNFTIKNGAIEIIDQYGSKQHMQIAYDIGNYYIMKWSMLSEENPYDQWAALNPNGYTNWYNYLTDSVGKINQGDTEGLYDTSTMKYTNAYPNPIPMIIDQNNTRLYVKECTPMGDVRESEYLLKENHIVSKISEVSYFTIKKYDFNTTQENNATVTFDTNTTQENNATVPPQTQSLDIYYPNGWSLSGVGKDENLSVSNIKCQNGTLKTLWKYKNAQWNLYVPSNIDYGYTTFDTLNNRDGFWVNCQ